MFKGSAARVAASAAAVTILAGTGIAAGAGAAVAAPASSSHTLTYSCNIPLVGSQKVSTKVTLSAPGKTTAGKTVRLSVAFAPSGLPSVAVTKVTVKSTLTESGAQKGGVTIGAYLAKANAATVKASLTGHAKLTKTGKVNFTLGSAVTFSLTSSFTGKISFTCHATSKKLPVLGTISVGKAHKAAARPAARIG